MFIVLVRLEAGTEAEVRKAAEAMGVTIKTVEFGGDFWHLNGEKTIHAA